ncbi:MAG: ABC transporter permease, partial [Mycobacteriaceae bacterium]
WYMLGEFILWGILTGFGIPQASSFLPVNATIATVMNSVNSGGSNEFFLTWPGAPLILLFWAFILCGFGWLRTRTRDIT